MRHWRLPVIYLIGVVLNVMTAHAQSMSIGSGPMVGHCSHRTARIWLQTTGAAAVQAEYWQEGGRTPHLISDKVQATAAHAFAVTLELDSLQPGTAYRYQVLTDGRRQPGTFRLDTPPLPSTQDTLTLAFGSCVYMNDEGIAPKGGDYPIFQRIAEKKPGLMFWIGDNPYLHAMDWTSRQGMQYRYSHMRALPEMQPLLQTGAHYAIWDDHDYGPNDSDRSYALRQASLETFQEFWPNPSYGLDRGLGIATAFSWGDVDFFLLDNRWFRSPQKRVTGERTILGKEQLEWLIDALAFSEASCKVIVSGGLILSTMDNPLSQNYIANYAEERAYLLSELEKNGIRNVLILSGDKHFAELTRYTDGRGEAVHEFTSSPLTAKANGREDANGLRVPGTLYQERNFGLVEFIPLGEGMKLNLRLYDREGQEVWNRSIELSEKR